MALVHTIVARGEDGWTKAVASYTTQEDAIAALVFFKKLDERRGEEFRYTIDTNELYDFTKDD